MMREKKLRFGFFELVLRINDHRADWITNRWVYRRIIRPILTWLERRSEDSSHNSNQLVQEGDGRIPVFLPRAPQMPMDSNERSSIVGQIQGHEWYHTIDLSHGVRTLGMFDHLPALRHIPIPERLDGKRCLDVATLDGFWAFEMERRGADEVIAIDIESWMDLDVPPYVLEKFRERGLDVPTSSGFEIAAHIKKSQVRRHMCNVYKLTPELFGTFDFVFCGDLLIHITNPILALQRIFSVTNGKAVFLEPYLPELETINLDAIARLEGSVLDCRWWQFSKSFLEKAIKLAGFPQVEFVGSVDIRHRKGREVPLLRAVFRAFSPAQHESQQFVADRIKDR